MKYKISYVIPTFNSVETLEATILSLIKQQSVDVKIIVVDSGSNDGTLEICHKWNIETHYVAPGNMYEAINYGLNLCNTKWLGYLNSDDLLYTNSLIRLIEHGELEKADVVYGVCDFIDIDGRFLYSFLPPKPACLGSVMKTRTSGMTQQTAIFKKDLYNELNGFNTKYRYAADYDFYARSVDLGALFSFLPNPSIACFRLHKQQLSQLKKNELLAEGDRILIDTLGKSNIYDIILAISWKISNIHNYLIKTLRKCDSSIT